MIPWHLFRPWACQKCKVKTQIHVSNCLTCLQWVVTLAPLAAQTWQPGHCQICSGCLVLGWFDWCLRLLLGGLISNTTTPSEEVRTSRLQIKTTWNKRVIVAQEKIMTSRWNEHARKWSWQLAYIELRGPCSGHVRALQKSDSEILQLMQLLQLALNLLERGSLPQPSHSGIWGLRALCRPRSKAIVSIKAWNSEVLTCDVLACRVNCTDGCLWRNPRAWPSFVWTTWCNCKGLELKVKKPHHELDGSHQKWSSEVIGSWPMDRRNSSGLTSGLIPGWTDPLHLFGGAKPNF